MTEIVGIRFRPVGKIYFFAPNDFKFELKEAVIVETSRGLELGRVAILPKEVDDKEIVEPLVKVLRKATDKDLEQVEKNKSKRIDTIKRAKAKAEKLNLAMKFVDAEYTFDNAKLVLYFTADNRIDFRELVKELAGEFKLRIELRQIGIRDESKIKGGIAPCGRVCCCRNHMPEFNHVSIKMAKTQGLSLNPVKISGLCGRLMCCLEFENEHYAESNKMMPKLGSEVSTPNGKGIVVNNNLLKHICRVKLEKSSSLESEVTRDSHRGSSAKVAVDDKKAEKSGGLDSANAKDTHKGSGKENVVDEKKFEKVEAYEYKEFPLSEIKFGATMVEDLEKVDNVEKELQNLID